MSFKLPKRGLRFAHLNICSLKNKVQELSSILHENNIHIMAISETHLDGTIDDTEVSIHGYNIFRLDRDRHGGGTAFYIQDHIPAKTRKDLGIFGVEALWLQVHIPHLKPILTCCCYRPPCSNAEYLNNICTMLQNVTDNDNEIYISGDMNIDWFASNCSLKRKLSNAATVCNLSQVIHLPTRINVNWDESVTSTCIDHFFTNCAEKCSKAVSVPVGFSDHNITALAIKIKVPKAGPKVIYKRMYKTFCENDFVSDVESIQWDIVLEKVHAEVALDSFMNLFSAVCDKHAPIKKRSVRSIKAPWLDDELRNYMKERDLLKKYAITSGSSADWQAYRSLRNKITKFNRQKKKHYYHSKFEECYGDSKKLWKVMNEAMGRSKMSKTPSFIEQNGEFITKASAIANYFNNYFLSKVNTLRNQMLPVNSNMSESIIKNHIMLGKDCWFEFKPIKVVDMEKLLHTIKCDKPCGFDNLDGRLLQLSAKLIAKSLCHIFNLCFEECVYPNLWKIAKVTPLSKNCRESFTGPNSRPISILPVLSKLLEGIVFKQIQHYFAENSINSDVQHAYKAGYSTSTALTSLTDDWLKQIDGKSVVGVVLLDFSAAFDVIDHELLLMKLLSYGFKDSATDFMRSYLANRKQCVMFNGTFSNIETLQCGIPQGSCLGPLLFSIFVNDLPYVSKNAGMVIYADDTTMYVSAENNEQVSRLLQQELMLVSEWVMGNRLKLNVSKTKCMVLGSKHALRTDQKLCLHLQGAAVEQVKEAKLLGVTIDETLSWSTHINNIVAKMSKCISTIRRSAYLLSDTTTKLVTQSLVLSNLDYCPTIWSSASKQELAKLQLTQNRAARLVLHCSVRSSVDGMHARLSWMKVEDRLACSLVLYLKNIHSSQRPFSLFSQLTPINDRHSYNTRQALSCCFTLPLPRTNALKKTVMYRAIVYWNMLPQHLTVAGNKSGFKKKLREAVIKKEIRLNLT